MSSEVSMEMHVMRLEDQLNRMNLVMAGQSRKIEELSGGMTSLRKRLKALEEGSRERFEMDSGGPSEIPPDGVNR